MISKSGLPKDHARCFIDEVFKGNEHTSRKLVASIENDKTLDTRTFQGENAYQEAKQWIKDNL